MSKKHILLLWLLAIVLVGGLYLINTTKKDSYSSNSKLERGDLLLPDFQAEEVSSITIESDGKSLTLHKKDDSWKVAERDDYPAQTSSINNLLRTLSEVKVTQSVEADLAVLAARFGMDTKSEEEKPTQLTLKDNSGKELAALTLGKNIESKDPAIMNNPMMMGMGGGASGRYLHKKDDDSAVYVTAELFSSLEPLPSSWLNHDFFKIEKPLSISVSQATAPDSTAWEFTRKSETEPFLLADKKDEEELDTEAVQALQNTLSYASFRDLLPAAEVESRSTPKKRQKAKITTADGFTYTLTFEPAKKEENENEDDPISAGDQYILSLQVSAKIAQEREKVADEKEEDAKKKDEEFAAQKKALEEQLANVEKLQNHSYLVNKSLLDTLLKKRSDFMKKEGDEGSQGGAPAMQQLPPGLTPIPQQPAAPRPRAQAVTPPIEVPPAPKKEESKAEKEEPKEEKAESDES